MKVNKASSLDKAQKAFLDAKETAAYAAQGRCTDAEIYSLSAYELASKGVNASSVDELKSISKKTKD